MSTKSVLEILEAEVNGHPVEQNGWGLYSHLLDLAKRIEANDHEGLVGALDVWLKNPSSSSPRTTMAIVITGDLKLTELCDRLKQFRQEELTGKYGPPRNTEWIDKVLQSLS